MTKVTTKKKLAVLGNGFLAGIIVGAYNKGLLEEYELTGILGRTKEKTEALAEKGGCRPCSTLEELLEDKPDYVQKKMEERSTLLPVPSAVLMCCGPSLLWDRHRLLSVQKRARNPFPEPLCLKKAL